MSTQRMHYDYDLAIIGSGGAAFAAAIEARRREARVVMIEGGTVGGTCVNIGCVPSKTLLAAAGARHAAAHHPFSGVSTSAGVADLAAVVAQKDELIDDMRQHKYFDLVESYGFDLLTGHATFVDQETLAVGDRAITARHFIIATGADPSVPDIPGLRAAGYLTSTTAMEQTNLPARQIVIGGGFVGLEQAQLFARLGSQVTLIGRVAPRAEPELASRLRQILVEENVTVINGRATAVHKQDGTTLVHTDGTDVAEGDAVLIATGRSGRTDGLNLDAAHVSLDDRGFIRVDTTLRTSSGHIFAAGDVAGGPQFVYVAAAQGQVAATNALNSGSEAVDYAGLPSVMFTDPQLASAGLTEAEALAAGHHCDCRLLELSNVPRALVNHDTRGAIKLVADRASGKVLGVHALAAGAGDLMLAASYAIKLGMTVTDIADTWAPYLTMSESLKLAAQAFTRSVDHLSCCAA